MNNYLSVYRQYLAKAKSVFHHNIYMMIGFYGIVAIILLCLSTKWFFHIQLQPIFSELLPPAWQNLGDVNHILGTDQLGQDIFDYLLVAYKTSIVMTMKSVIGVALVGVILNYMLFFVAPVRIVVEVISRVIVSIPPLLSAIVITLLFKNSVSYILFIVGLVYLPKLVYNVHERVMLEYKKTYITAARLDGLSTAKLLHFYIVPNILPTSLNEVLTLFGQVILTLTALTFLGFANKISQPDLGMMMYKMLTTIPTNHWAFIAPGIAIIVTIVLINLFNVGVNILFNRRNRN